VQSGGSALDYCADAGILISPQKSGSASFRKAAMPHIVVEYSANLENQIDALKLVEEVHQAALQTGEFETAAVRTRASRREYYAIADGHRDNAFVAIWVRVAPGRSPERRKRLGQQIFDAACKYLEPVCETTPIAISLEVQEIDNTAAFRKINLHSVLKERTKT
jgi:5-carboxymethyl-2-hydroxymuconate isomerase